MLFSELRFLLFFVPVFLGYWALRDNAWRKRWLLAASYVFYASWDWRFLALIFASTAVDFVAGARIAGEPEARRRRRWLVASLVANLGILGFFKYFNFFVRSGSGLLEAFGWGAPVRELSIVLPVGISFFTFQSMSYTIDVYRRRLAPTSSFADFALFVSFFPQLVAGPIVRARGFLPQLDAARLFRDVRVRFCLATFLVGFVKKACIADHLAVPVDAVFADDAAFGALSQWLALTLYSAQIYCDFSGYTDMAIGVAGLLGYSLVPNFDFPYLSRSVREFWRRWHISLSTWFRDYLYVPLGGSRRGQARTLRNLMIVFLLCGLWHGAAWTFVAFGACHGAVLLLERTRFEAARRALPAALQWLYTFAVVLLGWLFFRAEDLPQVGRLLATMLWGNAAAVRELPVLWPGVALGLAGAHLANARWRLVERAAALDPRLFAFAFGAAAAASLQWVATGHRPFIYFQF